MISAKLFRILLVIVVMVTMIVGMFQNVKESREEEGLIFSPDNSKSFKYFRSSNSTQVFVKFHKLFIPGGGSAVSIYADSLQIEAKWINNDTIEIFYPSNSDVFMKNDRVCNFKDCALIKYTER